MHLRWISTFNCRLLPPCCLPYVALWTHFFSSALSLPPLLCQADGYGVVMAFIASDTSVEPPQLHNTQCSMILKSSSLWLRS